MKRLFLGVALVFLAVTGAFAQSDMNDFQPLAVVRLGKTETITLKQLKKRAEWTLKQYEAYGITSLTVEQKKQLLEELIYEQLILQSAAKDGLTIPGDNVNSYVLAMLNRQFGAQAASEGELDAALRKQANMSLSDYMKKMTGMTLDDYKAYVKNNLIVQNYIQQKYPEYASVKATAAEINQFYAANETSFAQSEMLKLFLVVVPKGDNPAAAKAIATDLMSQYSSSSSKQTTEAALRASPDNGKKYQAGEILVEKTSRQAQALGWDFNKILTLFSQEVGFVSEMNETDNDYQFYTILQHYEKKYLGLYDPLQPDGTTLVYNYIEQMITQQKMSQYLSNASHELGKSLDTPENVDRKKTGSELEALLNW